MKKSLLLVFILISGVLVAAAKNDKDMRVPAGATHTANINAFNSFLDIAGKVDASVFLVGGQLRLSGEISGDVICLGAQVDIQSGAVIGRDLIVIGGHANKAPDCKISGDFYYLRTREDLKRITRTLLPFLPESGGLNFIRISKIFFWFILALLTLAILPQPVNRAADMLKKTPLRYGSLGLLALFIFIFALLIFIILSLVLIGIPLLVALMVLYFLILIFGRTVIFYFIGDRIASFFKLKNNAILFVILGTAVYALIKSVPWVGSLVLVGLDIFAVGISIGYFLQRRKLAI
ncbi:MAG: hypothetical protein JXI33_07470 [Candidatus Aminicenantes bacterium]|nr:hypothetical protein [Candidatus Aminicenantes bacterium]